MSHWCLRERHHAPIIEFENFSSVNAKTLHGVTPAAGRLGRRSAYLLARMMVSETGSLRPDCLQARSRVAQQRSVRTTDRPLVGTSVKRPESFSLIMGHGVCRIEAPPAPVAGPEGPRVSPSHPDPARRDSTGPR